MPIAILKPGIVFYSDWAHTGQPQGQGLPLPNIANNGTQGNRKGCPYEQFPKKNETQQQFEI